MFTNLNSKIEVMIAALGATAGYLFGGLDTLMTVFVTILIIDTLTGMLKSWSKGEYKSKNFRTGILKKTGYLLSIVLVVQLDILIGDIGALRGALILTFVANESISVIENLGEMGVQFPEIIVNSIESLKSKSKG